MIIYVKTYILKTFIAFNAELGIAPGVQTKAYMVILRTLASVITRPCTLRLLRYRVTEMDWPKNNVLTQKIHVVKKIIVNNIQKKLINVN